MIADTTVHEKNITYPTDSKQAMKIINKCHKIAQNENVKQRRSYSHTVKYLRQKLKYAHQPRRAKEGRKAAKKLKTIAGRVVRELNRKLPQHILDKYKEQLTLFQRVINQKPGDRNKIYSLHEPQTYCIAKGKIHKKFEFGSKASIVVTENSGIIVGAVNFEKNIHDSKTLSSSLAQAKSITGITPNTCAVDKGYKGVTKIGKTNIKMPQPSSQNTSSFFRRKMRKLFRKRAGIEAYISHLKNDHRLNRNFLKGTQGDHINLLMTAAAFNFKKWMRSIWLKFFKAHFQKLFFKSKQFLNFDPYLKFKFS